MSDATEAFRSLTHSPAVVTIDLHRGHLDPEVATLPLAADASAALVNRIGPILDACRSHGLPIFHLVTSYRDRTEILSNPYWRFQAGCPRSTRSAIAEHNLEGSPGLELMPGIQGPDDHIIATKKRYDSFVGTDLGFVLRSGGYDSILLMGVNTNSCVIATGIAASVRDYAVFFVDDGIDTMLGSDLHHAARQVLEASFGWWIMGAEALELLTERRR